MKLVILIAAFVWTVAFGVHMIREAWIIATRGVDALPVCRRWWCPEGIKNRMREPK